VEFLLVAVLFIVGSTLVFAGATGMTPQPKAPSGVIQLLTHSKELVDSARLGRGLRKRRVVSHTDLILADLLNELAELRREVADLRSSRS
jgi:hypothetical protein